MAEVVIALGSNLNNPIRQIREAGEFLTTLAEAGQVKKSPVYKSEPVGPAEFDFLNAIIAFQTSLSPASLFQRLKEQEERQGRPSRYPKWTARPIDLDIIAYDNLVVQADSLIIPHQEYTRRLFVLLPLQDVFPDWEDPVSAQGIMNLIEQAPPIRITKTTLNW